MGILVVALLPVLLQAIFGYGGHGFSQHVPSWLELKTLWTLHEWRAGWAPGANYGLGDPRFTYYPPVSFVVGAGLAMVLPFWMVPAAFTWLVFALCGLGMFFACREFVAREHRWKAALLYMLSPYLLTTALVRFAAPEALTLIWLPLVLMYFHRAVWRGERRAVMLLGCLLGLTWITDVPASIVLLYVLSIAVCVLAVVRGSVKVLPVVLFAEVIAAALAAFYLAPTWIERTWIHADATQRDRFELMFLFTKPRHGPLPVFTIGLWVISLAGMLLAILFARRGWHSSENRLTTRTWIVVAAVSLFFELPLSSGLWKHLPQMRLADFPYRFLAPVAVILPLMLLAESTSKRLRVSGWIVLGVLALLPVWEYGSAKEGLTDLRVLAPVWQNVGYRGWPEFVPAGAVAPLTPPQVDPVTVADPAKHPDCNASLESEQDDSQASGEKTILIDSSRLCKVRVGQFFFPYWRAIDDREIPLPIAADTDGLLLISVPAGRHTVRLKYVASSPARTASWMTSGICLGLVLLTVYIPRRKPVSFSGQSR